MEKIKRKNDGKKEWIEKRAWGKTKEKQLINQAKLKGQKKTKNMNTEGQRDKTRKKSLLPWSSTENKTTLRSYFTICFNVDASTSTLPLCVSRWVGSFREIPGCGSAPQQWEVKTLLHTQVPSLFFHF